MICGNCQREFVEGDFEESYHCKSCGASLCEDCASDDIEECRDCYIDKYDLD